MGVNLSLTKNEGFFLKKNKNQEEKKQWSFMRLLRSTHLGWAEALSRFWPVPSNGPNSARSNDKQAALHLFAFSPSKLRCSNNYSYYLIKITTVTHYLPRITVFFRKVLQLLIPFDPHLMDHLPLLATYESYLLPPSLNNCRFRFPRNNFN